MNPSFLEQPGGIELVKQAAQRLRAGEVVAFPTETVYGLGANALDPRAVARVFELKARPHFDPLIVHVGSIDEVDRIVVSQSGLARRLMERFWPGPLTLVLPKREVVPDIVTSGLPDVAVRFPAHPVAQRLIREAGVPLAAPSANRFGRVSPTQAQHVRDEFGEAVPWVIDAGPCAVGVESTVLSLDTDRPTLLRPGGVTLEELEAVVGPVRLLDNAPRDGSSLSAELLSAELHVGGAHPGAARPVAPGMLASHYAPTTPLVLLAPGQDAGLEAARRGWHRWGLLCLQRPAAGAGSPAIVEELSAAGDLREAAAGLFAAMRRLDNAGLQGILALPVPPAGLGRAILDRLGRAAVRPGGREA